MVILILLAITSGIVLAIILVVKAKEAGESRRRRTVASPYGVLMGPTNGELRQARDAHPAADDCVACDGYGCVGDGTVICKICDGRGTTLPIEKEAEKWQ